MNLLLLPFVFGAPQSVLDPKPPQSVIEPIPVRIRSDIPASDIAATYRQAVANGEFLVWFDEIPVRNFDGYNWTGTLNHSVVTISGPHNGKHVEFVRLKSATVAEIQTALAKAKAWADTERTVSLRVNPFRWPLPSAAHDSRLEAGPLPDGFDLGDMKRYKRAAYTQEIAVTDGRDRISPVSRLQIHNRDPRWLVSGGMLGFDGWRSDLYRNEKAASAREYVGNIAVWNGSNFQSNRGWRREFADGSKFLDVLSVDGRVFEVRQREKAQGRWNSEVVYENEKARPFGYAGLTVSCSKCHNARDGAGTGPYAGALVPGSDTVLSYPFAALEK